MKLTLVRKPGGYLGAREDGLPEGPGQVAGVPRHVGLQVLGQRHQILAYQTIISLSLKTIGPSHFPLLTRDLGR
jgi:hypothetical protein